MPETRSLKSDLLTLVLLALTIFLGAALLSYDPADPPSKLVWPERSETFNACGRSGAVAAALLFNAVGVGAYYLLLSLAVLDTFLLTRRGLNDPLLRLAGWLVSLLGVTSLAALVVPQLSPGPVIGSGGYLGAAGRGLLERHFAGLGAGIFSISLILAGLLLCTDYAVVNLAAMVWRGPVRGLLRGLFFVGSAYGRKLVKPSVKGAADDLVSDPELAVRIAGRQADEKDEAQQAEEETGEEPVAAEESEETPSTLQTATRSLAELLRIRKPKNSDEHEEVIEELDEVEVTASDAQYELPAIDLLLPGEPFSFEEQEKEVRRKASVLEKTFLDFGFNVRVVEIQTGPVIAQFEVELEAGLRLSKITGLADDLAIALRVPSVRIVAPIPGKNTVGIEVPNSERQLVRMREVMEEANGKAAKMRIPLYLGKDVAGSPMVVDLTTLPHLLIAGRTGTGKSVCLNTIIASMIMTRRPDEVRMLMIDPKMVELSPYKSLPHLMHPVVTDMRKAEAILAWAVEKMEERYSLLARAGVRHVSVYNQLGEEELLRRMQPENEDERRSIPRQMPFIVIVADEMADLMMTSAKEVETHIIRLAQKSRAVGIHLVLATQKPTVDVITGLIKSNLPARISFQVASRTDSRVVLDEMGAEKLLGNGDMLFLWPGTSALLRGQGTYLSDDEINSIIASVATSEPQFVTELVQLKAAEPTGEPAPAAGHRDDLYDAAVDVVIREGRGSVSLLQRALGIGYGRAARLIDYMAEDGIVGTYNGSQAREVLISLADWEVRCGRAAAPAAPEAAKPPRRSNKILMTPATPPAGESAPWENDDALPAAENEDAENEAEADESDDDYDEEEEEDVESLQDSDEDAEDGEEDEDGSEEDEHDSATRRPPHRQPGGGRWSASA